MQRIVTSISVRWRAVLRRRRSRSRRILLRHPVSDHMLRDIGLHEPRSTDDL